MKEKLEIICIGCGKAPDDLEEYQCMSKIFNEDLKPDETPFTPASFVQQEEGTFNRETGHFACTSCYIKMGQPSGPGRTRWVAP